MIRNFDGKIPRIAASALVNETAYVIGDVEIGENSSAWPGAVIRGDAGKIILGNNVHIQDNCVLHTNNSLIIADNVIVGHGAVVHCHRVGSNVLIGNKAVVLDDAEIGDNCVIAAGALVSPGARVPDNTLMMGIPAKPKGQLTQKDLEPLREGIEHYAAAVKKYKQQGF
jgi:carbonic anhydrase/acetyltransferase-like protein (isoleucine patch superfamily)